MKKYYEENEFKEDKLKVKLYYKIFMLKFD